MTDDVSNSWLYLVGFADASGNRLYEGDVTYDEWVTSFYWAITTMSTIGYGDISAHTELERSVAVVVMILGCCFFAWATGTITNVISKQPYSAVAFKKLMEEIEQFMSARGVPKEVVARVYTYYMMR